MSAKFLIISADTHSGAPPGAYHEYIDPEFRPMLKELEVENQQFLTRGVTQERYSRPQLDLIDERDAIRKGGLLGAWDSGLRLS